MNELEEIFGELREDVKKYLEKNMQKPSYYLVENMREPFFHNRRLLREYHKHKENVSKLCGWDADDKYDQQLFDSTIGFIELVMDSY